MRATAARSSISDSTVSFMRHAVGSRIDDRARAACDQAELKMCKRQSEGDVSGCDDSSAQVVLGSCRRMEETRRTMDVAFTLRTTDVAFTLGTADVAFTLGMTDGALQLSTLMVSAVVSVSQH